MWTAFQNKIHLLPIAVGSDDIFLWFLTYTFFINALSIFRGLLLSPASILPFHTTASSSVLMETRSEVGSCHAFSNYAFLQTSEVSSLSEQETKHDLVMRTSLSSCGGGGSVAENPLNPKIRFIFRSGAWPIVHAGTTHTGLIWAAVLRSGQSGESIQLARRDPWDPRAKEICTWCCKCRTY